MTLTEAMRKTLAHMLWLKAYVGGRPANSVLHDGWDTVGSCRRGSLRALARRGLAEMLQQRHDLWRLTPAGLDAARSL